MQTFLWANGEVQSCQRINSGMVHVFVNFSRRSDDNDGDCGDDDVHDDEWLVAVHPDSCHCLWHCSGWPHDAHYVYDAAAALKMHRWRQKTG